MHFFILTIIVAIIGGTIGIYLKVPAGALLGALIAVSVYNIIWGLGYVPDNLRVLTRIIAGTLIGSRMTKKDVYGMKNIFSSAVILIVSMAILFPAVGFLIYRLSNLDLSTSLFASAPGGMTDMALVADELGADTPKVVLMQLLRIFCILGFFPVLLRAICKRYRLIELCEAKEYDKKPNSIKRNHEQNNQQTLKSECIFANKEPQSNQISATSNDDKATVNYPVKNKILKSIFTIVIGAMGGLIGIWLDLPAGAMMGSVLTVGCASVLTGKTFMTVKARKFTQISVGAVLGSSITMDDVIGLKDILIPGVILVFSLIFLNLIVGYLIFKWGKMDLATALFASTPGGVTEMVLVADELGVDTPKVALLQLIRLIGVIIIFPILLRFLSSFLL